MACGKLTTCSFNPTWLTTRHLFDRHSSCGELHPQTLLRACIPKPDDTTAYSREAMPCHIQLQSVVRRIKKRVRFEARKNRQDTLSLWPRGLHSSKSEPICTFGSPISDKRGAPALTDPVYSQLFTSSYVPATAASSSQLLNYVLSARSQSRVLAVKPKSRGKAWRGGGIFVLTLQEDTIGHASIAEGLSLSTIMLAGLVRVKRTCNKPH